MNAPERAPQPDALPTVLVVDDEVRSQDSLRRTLEEDFRVLTASDADAARKLMTAHEVSVILCDQRMPGMSGVEFLKELRERWPDAVRIIISGYTDSEDIIAGLKLVYGETTVAYSPNVPKDTVIGIQLPPDDTLINTAQQVVKGSTVNLVVSNGLVKIPDLTGQAVTQAQSTLTGSELQLSVQLTPDNGCSGQNVTSQSLVGDQPQRSTVTLVYCAAG
jgi:CheY-like chemotaxis protein